MGPERPPGTYRIYDGSQQRASPIRRVGLGRRSIFPAQAKLVRAGKDGAPITDGVFPESKEFLAGYWIVDVDSPERAYADRGESLGSAGSRRGAVEHADRSAPVYERASTGNCNETAMPAMDTTSEHLLRELAPQVLGAVVRRFRDFSAAEDAVQEALIAAATQWPQEGVPENPRGWLIQVASRA